MGSNNGVDKLSLDSIRKTLIELEDTIVFSVIERAKFPLNSRAHKNGTFPGICSSLMEHLVRGTEVVQSQARADPRPP
ncbi:hypothetical protein KSS87_019264 [Heliosperma pusillum]|nr:hypothetical protein KSS87_019264 [Heliosperma pusillum]